MRPGVRGGPKPTIALIPVRELLVLEVQPWPIKLRTAYRSVMQLMKTLKPAPLKRRLFDARWSPNDDLPPCL